MSTTELRKRVDNTRSVLQPIVVETRHRPQSLPVQSRAPEPQQQRNTKEHYRTTYNTSMPMYRSQVDAGKEANGGRCLRVGVTTRQRQRVDTVLVHRLQGQARDQGATKNNQNNDISENGWLH